MTWHCLPYFPQPDACGGVRHFGYRFGSRKLRVFSQAVLLMFFSAHMAHAEAGLAPHRAYYSAKIAQVKQTSQIVNAQGKMVIELAESCEGWETVQGTELLFTNNRGEDFVMDIRFTSWESRDGRQFHFNYVHKKNDIVQMELLGRAEFPEKGMAGTAFFSKPAHGEVSLPKGAVFPTEHLSMLIAHADAGKMLFSKAVFDGTTDGGPYEISAVLSQPDRFPEGKKDGLERLSGEYVWPIRLAFFSHGAVDAMPEMELGVWLLRSGVAERIVSDHDTFVIASELERVEWLPSPKC